MMKNINKKIQKTIITDKGKNLVKAEDQPTIQPVQNLKGKSRKITCSYNNKVRDTHKHTHEVKNNDKNLNMEEKTLQSLQNLFNLKQL